MSAWADGAPAAPDAPDTASGPQSPPNDCAATGLTPSSVQAMRAHARLILIEHGKGKKLSPKALQWARWMVARKDNRQQTQPTNTESTKT